jgi:hypothetical protein
VERYFASQLEANVLTLSKISQIIIGAGVAMSAHAQQTESQAPRNDLAFGAYYSKGDYGQTLDTSIYYFPLSYERSFGDWNLQASVPYLEISGAGNVLVNVGGLGRGELEALDNLAAPGNNRGIGDTVLSATYQLPAFSNAAPFFDLGFEVKIPTASEGKGLGTGAYDYGLQLDAYQQMGQTTLFATLGYKIRGRSELFNRMSDSGFVSLGFARPMSERISAGVIYDFREAASANSGETHEVLPYVSWAISNEWTVMSYLVKGFTKDSADIAAGVQLNYRW